MARPNWRAGCLAILRAGRNPRATLAVGHGSNFQFQSVAAAIAASASGDTIQIQAGNYVDDYAPPITHDLTIVGVGGQVQMIATAANPPPNEKGILAIEAQGPARTSPCRTSRSATR